MVLTGGTIFWVVFFFFCIWVPILSILFFRMMRHYNRLTNGITKNGLKGILESILDSHEKTQKRIIDIEGLIERIAKEGKRHIGKIGIVRFNPFADTGGSQSFTLAILDSENNGIVMTSLYARNGNRWYVKEILRGAGKDFALSKEEEKAIKLAQPV